MAGHFGAHDVVARRSGAGTVAGCSDVSAAGQRCSARRSGFNAGAIGQRSGLGGAGPQGHANCL
jgi:hypothetical protein